MSRERKESRSEPINAVSKKEPFMDRGEKALLDTGLVPKGFTFKTNVSKTPIDSKITAESIKTKYEIEGYEVVIIPDKGFSTDGTPTPNTNAIVVKKRSS